MTQPIAVRSSRRRLSALAAICGVSVLLAMGGAPNHALSQTAANTGFPPPFPAYPSANSFESIKLWVAGATNLDPHAVVLTNAEAVFAFEDAAAPDPTGAVVRRQVREEVITPDLARRLGGRSAMARIEFDCAHAETTVEQVVLYPGASLGGGAGRLIPAAHWLAANTDLDLTDLAQVACAKPSPPWRAPPAAATTLALRGPAAQTAGGRWVQIGAFASDAVAQRRWTELKTRWPAETAALSERTEPAPHGATVLRRALVGPFPDRTQAQAFCAALRRRGDDCLAR